MGTSDDKRTAILKEIADIKKRIGELQRETIGELRREIAALTSATVQSRDLAAALEDLARLQQAD